MCICFFIYGNTACSLLRGIAPISPGIAHNRQWAKLPHLIFDPAILRVPKANSMTTLATSNNSNTSPTSTSSTTNKLNVNPSDFIKMMVTQLENQDPLQPTQSDQLLAQMSQIGQLQASTDLQSSLQGLVLQNQIGAASSLIGKTVSGIDSTKANISGVVNSVQVAGSNVNLELDNGKSLSLGQVTSIAQAATTAKAA